MRKGIYYLRKSLNDFLKIIIISFRKSVIYKKFCLEKKKYKIVFFSAKLVLADMPFLIFAKVQI